HSKGHVTLRLLKGVIDDSSHLSLHRPRACAFIRWADPSGLRFTSPIYVRHRWQDGSTRGRAPKIRARSLELSQPGSAPGRGNRKRVRNALDAESDAVTTDA